MATPFASSAPATAPQNLTLTRRGRFVVRTLPLAFLGLLLALAATFVFIGQATQAEASSTEELHVERVTVGYGDTLWSIAGDVAPEQSRYETIDQIAELNKGLTTSDLAVGDTLFVPVYQN